MKSKVIDKKSLYINPQKNPKNPIRRSKYLPFNIILRKESDFSIDSLNRHKYKENKKWLDFGMSTEHGKVYLNEGLCSQKEGFGGRTGVYEIWELKIQ